jgi:hypothetical protein
MRRLVPSILLILALAALPAAAQHPNVERGFAPGQSFQIGDIDHVNLFNGSLVITIPLGLTYPVGGGLSYGLTLTYSSGVWDFREADGGETPLPSRTSNAGLGWRVSLGRYLPWSDPDNDRQVDLYIGPDGAEHWFYKTLHAGDADDPGDGTQPYQQSVQYTRDGSYLRSKKLSGGGWFVEFPDGQFHSFDTTGRLVRMEDRFGNYVNVAYGADAWTLTDKHLRSQKIHFQTLWHGGAWVPMVDRVELTAFGGANTATYDFSYTQANLQRACATSNLLPLTTDVQLLSSVSLPDGSSYQMPGYETSPSDCRKSGVINSLVLPTFDGLGHYRRSETGGNFASGNFRVSTIGYNPNAGTYELDANGNPKAGFTMVASTGRWLLNLYWDRVVSDGAAGEQDLNCFDGTTGFLTGRRVLRTPGAMSANDVLVLYEKDISGNVTAETFYGGDPGGLSTTAPCSSAAGSQYRLVHTWQSGALATSKYDTASFYSVRRDIDARTGLPSADYDTADLKTAYEYD